MKIGNHREVIRFFVSDIGRDDIILGHSWLQKHNPGIDWRSQGLSFPQGLPYCQLSLDDQWRQSAAPKANFITHQHRHPHQHMTKRNSLPLPDIPLIYEGEEGLLHQYVTNPSPPLEEGDSTFIEVPDEKDIQRTTQSTTLAPQARTQK